MKKIDKSIADAYFKARTTAIIIYLAIGLIASFGVVFAIDGFRNFTIMGAPAHYYMGAQGAIVIFITLLFTNAIVSDMIDKKYGIDDKKNAAIGGSKVHEH